MPTFLPFFVKYYVYVGQVLMQSLCTLAVKHEAVYLVDDMLTTRTVLDSQIDLVQGMMDCLYAECIPCITDCVLAELEKLGQKYRVALKVAKVCWSMTQASKASCCVQLLKLYQSALCNAYCCFQIDL